MNVDLSFQTVCLEITLKCQAMCILPEIFRQYTDFLSESVTDCLILNIHSNIYIYLTERKKNLILINIILINIDKYKKCISYH